MDAKGSSVPMSAVTIRLYDPKTNEVKDEFSTVFIPWRILKEVVKLQKALNPEKSDDLTEEVIDSLGALVVEIFGNQFTLKDLQDGADLLEVSTAIRSVMSRARGAMGTNPTPGQ
jgi:hypothetical protein